MSCSLILLAYASFSDCLENIKDKENSRRNNSNNSLNNNLELNNLNSVSMRESEIRSYLPFQSTIHAPAEKERDEKRVGQF